MAQPRLSVEAKGKTLPKLLAESKTSELAALRAKLEPDGARLAHEKELSKDKAQRLVEKNEAKTPEDETPDLLRELAIVYQERIEIVKVMLAAVQEEVANRGR